MMIGTYEEFSSIVVNAELVFAHIYGNATVHSTIRTSVNETFR